MLGTKEAYEDWLGDLTQIFDREREDFNRAAEDYSFRTDWNDGLTPREAFDRYMGFAR